MNKNEALFEYALRMGDSALIHGQRLAEWCGHGPELEQDIALTNISLDQIGQAANWLALAGKIEGKGRDADQLAFLRDAWEFRNVQLVEYPNEDWAYTLVKSYLFDSFNFLLHQRLSESANPDFAAIAAKSLKEIAYHKRYSAEWVLRLGDGTELSHRKAQAALDDLWPYTGELCEMNEVDELLFAEGIVPDLRVLESEWRAEMRDLLAQATLEIPERDHVHTGSRQGIHTEYLGHILTEMQFLQRAYPGLEW